MSRILLWYRPALPSLRAQSIGVVHGAHALAARGHDVTLLADRTDSAATPESCLAAFDLALLPTLHLHLAPVQQPGLAGLWARAERLRWMAGPPGVILARDERAPLVPPGSHRLIIEAHGLESALAEERGQDPIHLQKREAKLAQRADVLVANCEGVLAAWARAHGPDLPATRAVLHNGAAPGRLRASYAGPNAPIRVAGSLRAYKGFGLLAHAALPATLEIAGGSPEEITALGPQPDGIRLLPPLPYPAVPDWLAGAGALLLPLSDNLFGRHMTSPLKLWDYLATRAPIIAPDLPCVTAIIARTGVQMHLHRPDDIADLTRAAAEALAAGPRAPFLRTWDQRAAELEALL